MNKLLPLILILFAAPCVGEPKSMDELESDRIIQEGLEAIDELKYNMEKTSNERMIACLKAFGHDSYCQCIDENIPWVFTFDDYIAITTKTKNQNEYDKLDDDFKKAYDVTIKARDQCVEQLF